jgi:hypothetical protein
MKIHTFVGKISIEGLQQMDDQINSWMKRLGVEPVHIKQSLGMERHHGGQTEEPVLVVSVWYQEEDED